MKRSLTTETIKEAVKQNDALKAEVERLKKVIRILEYELKEKDGKDEKDFS